MPFDEHHSGGGGGGDRRHENLRAVSKLMGTAALKVAKEHDVCRVCASVLMSIDIAAICIVKEAVSKEVPVATTLEQFVKMVTMATIAECLDSKQLKDALHLLNLDGLEDSEQATVVPRDELPDDLREQIDAFLKKRKGGGDERASS